MAWPKRMPLVEVRWLDSATGKGWHRPDQWRDLYDMQPVRCRTVGYLYRKTKRKLAVMQSINEEGQLAEVLVIPRSVVTRLSVLRKRK